VVLGGGGAATTCVLATGERPTVRSLRRTTARKRLVRPARPAGHRSVIERFVSRLRATVRQWRPARSCSSTVAGISLLTVTFARHGVPATDEAGIEIRTVSSRAGAGATTAPYSPAVKATVTAHLRRRTRRRYTAAQRTATGRSGGLRS
jgi:hypothetical protein